MLFCYTDSLPCLEWKFLVFKFVFFFKHSYTCRENEVLKVQLKKYVGAVQMLKREGQTAEGEVEMRPRGRGWLSPGQAQSGYTISDLIDSWCWWHPESDRKFCYIFLLNEN